MAVKSAVWVRAPLWPLGVWRNWLARIVWDDEVVSSSLTTPTMDFLFSFKNRVDARLEKFLRRKKQGLSNINHWGSDVIETLLPFVTAGKTIRGSLVVYSYLLFNKTIPDYVLDAAAALELIHSGFLVHDDIMDKDTLRRGMKAIHVQYGEAIGICVGDLLFFLGYELLTPNGIALASREFANVAVAQMQDVSGGGDTLATYTYKTARYTFSLPMMAGAILAGADKNTTDLLEKLGEAMGLLFQIRDDELDQSESKLGENKLNFARQANTIIRKLRIAQTHKKELAALVDFCQNRTK